jgi:hypothetical protein
MTSYGASDICSTTGTKNLCMDSTRYGMLEETLRQMIVIGQASLRYVFQFYMIHYHHERNHQGRNNQLISAELGVGRQSGVVVYRERLG